VRLDPKGVSFLPLLIPEMFLKFANGPKSQRVHPKEKASLLNKSLSRAFVQQTGLLLLLLYLRKMVVIHSKQAGRVVKVA
jgi:hypothetical protein